MPNTQEEFLKSIKDNKTPVTVFLINGVKLQGLISWYGETSLLLKRDGHTQLIYSHAISTIMPNTVVDIVEEQDDSKNKKKEKAAE